MLPAIHLDLYGSTTLGTMMAIPMRVNGEVKVGGQGLCRMHGRAATSPSETRGILACVTQTKAGIGIFCSL